MKRNSWHTQLQVMHLNSCVRARCCGWPPTCTARDPCTVRAPPDALTLGVVLPVLQRAPLRALRPQLVRSIAVMAPRKHVDALGGGGVALAGSIAIFRPRADLCRRDHHPWLATPAPCRSHGPSWPPPHVIPGVTTTSAAASSSAHSPMIRFSDVRLDSVGQHSGRHVLLPLPASQS